mgnify:CR=1 FL=1
MNDLTHRVLKRNPQSVCLGWSTEHKPDAEYQFTDVLLRDRKRVVMARQAHGMTTYKLVTFDQYTAQAKSQLGVG